MRAAKGTPAARLSDEQLFDWLRLIRSENVGPRTFRALVNALRRRARRARSVARSARRGGARRPIRIATADEIERESRPPAGQRAFLALGEAEYPPALRQIDSAPPILALRGREEALQQPSVAIVGSRNASAAGLTFAERLARGIGRAGYVVVSGLARGIDLRAHAASLETGAVGVLAGGHARPYPNEALPLIERMVEYRRGRLRDAGRMGAARARFPPPQPDRLGACAGDDGGRGRARLGLAHHRPLRARSEPPGVRRPRLAARPARRRNQRPPEAGRDDLRFGRRRRVGDRAADLRRLGALEGDGAGEPLWGEQALLGVDPENVPRAPSGDQFDEPAARAMTSPTGRGDARPDRALLGPSPITLDDLARAAEARRARCAWRCSSSNSPGASNIPAATASRCGLPTIDGAGLEIRPLRRISRPRSRIGLALVREQAVGVRRRRLRPRRSCERRVRPPTGPCRGNKRADRGWRRSPSPRVARSCRHVAGDVERLAGRDRGRFIRLGDFHPGPRRPDEAAFAWEKGPEPAMHTRHLPARPMETKLKSPGAKGDDCRPSPCRHEFALRPPYQSDTHLFPPKTQAFVANVRIPSDFVGRSALSLASRSSAP